MLISKRRLVGNGRQSHTVPVISNSLEGKPISSTGNSKAENFSLAQYEAYSNRKPSGGTSSPKSSPSNVGGATVETADSIAPLSMNGAGHNTQISEIVTRTYLTPLLQEIVPDYDFNLAQPPTTLYRLYRDIYYYDTISGSAVETITSLAFSDFDLTGLEGNQLNKFVDSIDNLRVRRLLPQMSIMFLVYGMFVAQMPWESTKKIFKNLVPHNPSFTTLHINPIFGKDPSVAVDFQSALAAMRGSGGNKRNRSKESTDDRYGLPEAMFEGNYTIPEDELLFMTRKGMAMDIRGISYFKRVLPIWLMEKAMLRGTLDQATKRQRGITHIMAGEEDWVPTAEDMRMLAEMWANADLDPLSATFVTRNGININEVGAADAFWKYPDIYDFASQAKMRALGINEAVLSGDATIATMDTALSLFVESVREHRDTITYETFYERMFPRIAVENNIFLKKTQKNINPFNTETARSSGYEIGSVIENFLPHKHAIPRVQWHKRLRPEADTSYLEMLGTLEEKGIPVPLQMWAASGGMDMDSLLNSLPKDVEQRKVVQEWKEKVKPEGAEGEGGEGGYEGASTADFNVIGLANRDFAAVEEAYGFKNVTKGKRHLLSTKGRKTMQEVFHRKLAEAAVNVAKRENAKAKLEEASSGKTISIPNKVKNG